MNVPELKKNEGYYLSKVSSELPESDKYGHKAMLGKLLEEYPELKDLKKSLAEGKIVVEGDSFYIIRKEEKVNGS
jgi:hypothetical protein